MGMMNVLMQLRKVCNHPDLFERKDTDVTSVRFVALSHSYCLVLISSLGGDTVCGRPVGVPAALVCRRNQRGRTRVAI